MVDRVLVVDDDPSLAATLEGALAGYPLSIELASSATAAIEMLSEGPFCGMVLDLVLDGGSGFDVLEHMERNGINVPTVVVTEKLPAYVREMLDEDRVKLVFPKPVQPRLLATVVLGLCRITV